MPIRSIPNIQIVPVRSQAGGVSPTTTTPLGLTGTTDLRRERIKEFLMARSLAPKSRKAYQQDLERFLRWTNTPWKQVTPRQVAQFKEHLMGVGPETGERLLADATVCRTLTTLKNFYGWMFRSRYVDGDPTTEVDKPKLKEPVAQNIKDDEIKLIYQAANDTSLPERNVALVSALLHGLRASEAVGLNLKDYDGTRLIIREAKADSKGRVPLAPQAQVDLDNYLKWRIAKGELLHPDTPIFVSHSRRNQGQRITYDTIRKVVDLLEQKTGLDLHAHQFRHTFISNLLLKKVNPYHVMTLSRNKSPQSFRHYTKAADQVAAEAAFYDAILPKQDE